MEIEELETEEVWRGVEFAFSSKFLSESLAHATSESGDAAIEFESGTASATLGLSSTSGRVGGEGIVPCAGWEATGLGMGWGNGFV